MFKRIKNFKKNFDDTYDEMQEDREEEDFYIDSSARKAIKDELVVEAKDSLKSLGIFAGVALVFIIVMVIIVLLLKPQISKGINILMSKLDKIPIEDVKDPNTPDSPSPDNPSSNNPITSDKVDCTKPFYSSYGGLINGIDTEIGFGEDGSFYILSDETGTSGNYTISDGTIKAKSSDGILYIFKISKNCSKITYNGFTLNKE